MQPKPYTVQYRLHTRLGATPQHPHPGTVSWHYIAAENQLRLIGARVVRADQDTLQFLDHDLPSWLTQPDTNTIHRATRLLTGHDILADIETILTTSGHTPAAILDSYAQIRNLVMA